MIIRAIFIAQIFMVTTIFFISYAWTAAQDAVGDPVVLCSSEEVYAYGHTLIAVSAAKDAATLRALNAKAREKVSIKKGITLAFSDYAFYQYRRALAFSFSEYNIAEMIITGEMQSTGAEDAPLTRYNNAIKCIEEYFANFGDAKSALPNVQHNLLQYRIELQQTLGISYNSKIALLTAEWERNLSEIKELAPKPITAFRNVLDTIETLRSENSALLQSLALPIPWIKVGLIEALCTQEVYRKPEQKQNFLKQARNVCKELNNNSPEHRRASKAIEAAETNIHALTKHAALIKSSVVLRGVRFKNNGNAVNKAVLEALPNSLWKDIKAKEQTLISLDLDTVSFKDIDVPGKKQSVIDAMQDIENTIASRWEVPLQGNLTKVYEYYEQTIGAHSAVSYLHYYTMILIHEVRFEEALPRAEILLRLSENNRESYAAHILYAMLKNMLGEPEAWLALVEKLESIAQVVASQKSEAQQLSRTQRRNKIKREKKKAQARQQREAEDRQRGMEERTQRMEARRRPVGENPAVDEDILAPTRVDEAAFQAARLQRHADAEVRRAEQAANERKAEASFSVGEAAQSAVFLVDKRKQEREGLLASSALKFHELYLLSGLALRVNQAIENEEWRFTREELLHYFKAVGCNIHAGPHTKVGLPEATYVKMEDEIITILNTFAGGSLTLPTWEQDRVPAYLKKQILAARDRLRVVAIKARNIAEGSH